MGRVRSESSRSGLSDPGRKGSGVLGIREGATKYWLEQRNKKHMERYQRAEEGVKRATIRVLEATLDPESHSAKDCFLFESHADTWDSWFRSNAHELALAINVGTDATRERCDWSRDELGGTPELPSVFSHGASQASSAPHHSELSRRRRSSFSLPRARLTPHIAGNIHFESMFDGLCSGA